jgi:chlorophyllide a reductase subunit X
MMAQQGKKVLLIGCDPEVRHHVAAVRRQGLPDHHRDLAPRRRPPARSRPSATSASSATACSPWSSAARKSAAAAAGAASSTASSCWRKLGFHDWDFDYVLLDFLGDVVCGGFGLPIARDMCQKVIVVGSNDLQSLYVANNVCSAVEYFRKLGGNVGVAGMVINKDDGTGEAQAFAERSAFPVLAAIPAMTTSAARAPTTRSSASPAASGAAVRGAGRSMSPRRRRNTRAARPGRAAGLFDQRRDRAATWCWSRRP